MQDYEEQKDRHSREESYEEPKPLFKTKTLSRIMKDHDGSKDKTLSSEGSAVLSASA